MTKNKQIYQARQFPLSGLKGISDKTLEMHFKLYEGYVKQTNILSEQINEFLNKKEVDQENIPGYSEIKRRLGFEYNGMVLHEYYFGNLKKEAPGKPKKDSVFYKKAQECFGDYEVWKEDFVGVGKMRGVGWAICYLDPLTHRLSNHWITLHETGNIAGYTPLLVMDVWEHAYLLDYKPSERAKYIESFFSNVCWDTIDRRLNQALVATEEKHRMRLSA